jgi:hypothetical protein
MSVGHPHKTPNLLTGSAESYAMLRRLLRGGGAPELMKRWQKFDGDHDIVYTAGYNTAGTTRYADRNFVHALFDPEYATHILGAPIDTGLSPDDTLLCVLHHEEVEKVILDADNPVDFYDHVDEPGGFGAHEYATLAEHELVRKKGGTPAKYEAGLKAIIAFCQHKPLVKVPKDYSCAPLLDDPGAPERAIIKKLRALGVADAFKVSKASTGYKPTNGSERCSSCTHWIGDSRVTLAPCQIVDGLVRTDRICKRFEAIKGQKRPKSTDIGKNSPGLNINRHAGWRDMMVHKRMTGAA